MKMAVGEGLDTLERGEERGHGLWMLVRYREGWRQTNRRAGHAGKRPVGPLGAASSMLRTGAVRLGCAAGASRSAGVQ